MCDLSIASQQLNLSQIEDKQMNTEFIARMIGRFMVAKALDQQNMGGTQQAARNLRKQGVPLAVALLILVGRV